MAKDYIDEEEMQNDDYPEDNQGGQPEEQPKEEPKQKKEVAPLSEKTVVRKKKKKKKRHVSADAPTILEKRAERPGKSKSTLYWIIGIVLLLIAAAIIYATLNKGDNTGDKNGGIVDGKGLVITEYSDFECPFCKRAFPVVQQLKEYYGSDIQIVYKHYPLPFHPNAKKAAEASECARDQGKFWEYHDYIFTKAGGLTVDELKGYAKDIGLDTAKFNSCLDSGEKAAIVDKDSAEGQGKGVTGTPTFFINGEMVVGAQPIEAFAPIIDKALGKNSTILQDMYKNEPDVILTVVNDKTCTTCDASRIATVVRQFFPKMTVTTIDISSTEGKTLIKDYSLEKVPSYVLSKNIEEASKYKENPNLQTAFAQAADGYKILDAATGAERFIDPEKQKAQDEALAVKKKLAKEKLGVGTKPQVDFFIMSYCPYGNQAEEAIEKAMKVLGDKAEFKERFVIYSNYNGGGAQYCLDKDSKYCSMHGIQELNQNIRERCVYESDGTAKMFEFMLAMNAGCTAQNADTCWKDVAKKAGLDVEAISTCEKDKGEDIVASELELNQLLEVSGSPTVFINGEPYEGARTPEGFLAGICASFDEKPAECDEVPEPVDTTTAPAGNCG